jgi:hypothetical protein
MLYCYVINNLLYSLIWRLNIMILCVISMFIYVCECIGLRNIVIMMYKCTCTARTARFSKKSLRSDIGEIKKMSEKLKQKSVLTPRNVREKSNTVIYYKTPTLTIKRHEIKKWDINLYLYICMFLRLSFLIIWMIHSKYLFSFSGVQAMWSFFVL